MKTPIILMFVLFTICNMNAQEKVRVDNHNLRWHLDYEKATEITKKEKKLLFLYFTGSDWCGACKKLEETYFAKKQFIKLSKDFVLVEVDFLKKTLNKEYAIKNRHKLEWKYDLKEKYNVIGFPSIIVIDKDGNVKGRVEGYLGDDSPKRISNLLNAIINSTSYMYVGR